MQWPIIPQLIIIQQVAVSGFYLLEGGQELPSLADQLVKHIQAGVVLHGERAGQSIQHNTGR